MSSSQAVVAALRYTAMAVVEADAPQRTDSTQQRGPRVATWRFTTARIFVYSLVAFQIAHALWVRPSLVAYIRSYWAITYRHGFVRRGLTGSALEWITGPPSASAIERAALVVSALALVSVVLLIE